MLVFGISGKICSGKSFLISKIVNDNKDYKIIDVDKIGHIALEKTKDELVKVFSNIIITNDKIDRKKLGSLVFSDKEKLKQLENIVHPYMKKLVKEKLEEYKKENIKFVFIDAATLHRLKLDLLCDALIFVRTSFCIRLKRYKKRTNLGFLSLIRVLLNQKDVIIDKKYNKKPYIIINNNKDYYISYRQIVDFCSRISAEETLDE